MENVKEFYFGFDLENIERVMDYVEKNYGRKDYKMWIEIGGDVMNSLEVFNEKMLEDGMLLELIKRCEGGGVNLYWDEM